LSNHWPIGLIGVISLGLIALSASTASLSRRLISLVSFVGLLTHRLFRKRLAAAIIEATQLISWLLKFKQEAACGVATARSSTTETAASTYNFTASSHSLVRKKMWWWLALARNKMLLWLASFGESYNGDVLQYTKQLFFSGFRK
jgi:hypothetical protein